MFIGRGFYPKGRGEVVVTCAPVKHLSAVDLTDPGHVKTIRLHAFNAGAVPRKVTEGGVGEGGSESWRGRSWGVGEGGRERVGDRGREGETGSEGGRGKIFSM